MNAEAIVADLQNEIKVRLDSEEGMYVDKNLTSDSYLKMVLRSIEALGIKLIPAAPQVVDGSYLYDFARVVRNWNAEMEKFSDSDVNAGQVIQALQSEGWTILPPG
jgi:hypothetical protein